MAKPKSKATGNADNTKRGRGLGPDGQKSKPGTKLSGKQADPAVIKPDDYSGHKSGKRR
jgi:hypothetical protein